MQDEKTSKRPERPAPPARQDRLKAALKANMARRKAQAKGRAEQGGVAGKATEQDDG